MLENPILNAAFVIAITAFFTKNFNLADNWALLCAFLVALFISFVPEIILLIPAASGWLTALVNVIILFLTASGGYDLTMKVAARVATPKLNG